MDYIKALVDIVGEKNVKTDQIERLCHSRDMSVHEGIPDAIVFAKTTEEVSKILKLANDNDVKIIPGARERARPGPSSPVLAGSSSM